MGKRDNGPTTSVGKLCLAALLLAVGIVLPQTLHLLGGRVSGSMLLPMHLPVFVAGMLLGGSYGLAIGIVTPALSFLITGMPSFARLPFMVAELAAYGLTSGLLSAGSAGKTGASKRWGVFATLVVSQVAGRIVYGCALFAALHLFGMDVRPLSAVTAAFVAGLPGIAIQLALIPPIVIFARKRMQAHERDTGLDSGRKVPDEA